MTKKDRINELRQYYDQADLSDHIEQGELFPISKDHPGPEGPGVYLLHFTAPVNYGHGHGQERNYGDSRHYIGQTADMARRLIQHRKGWRGQDQGASYVRYAGSLGIDYVLGYIVQEADETQRIAIERELQQNPAASCTQCIP
ncbi:MULTISPECIES: hypothetical protein [unclassified Pseudonocardia]|uniref:hypothetical protein n=1 Tax=unclassified Pseudonocardia TaxID=2619320 RepID=UPI0001FFDB8F|nr:hypothetical protein [Pseudonocardia sp. Ae707_Ps1]OLM08751.1 hypothetical protein Ae707Ps1_6264c [Pseudonocardia sp. Ae707_Ps1]OLM08767.1 hypothetical protein Ae707Ps1_6280c [Pseudonocardia sp. Ae707_Ps1]